VAAGGGGHNARPPALRTPKSALRRVAWCGSHGLGGRPTSARLPGPARAAYGRLLAWLQAQGVDLEAEAPVARITRERLRGYVAFLREGRSSVTVASYLGVLCMVLVAMFPDEDWRWVQAANAG
jgi:hypothetical protein